MLAAAVSDVRTGRIPAWLTLSGILAGMLLWAPDATPRHYAGVLGVAALAFAVGFVLFAVGILGGGDGKLLTCVAVLTGPGLFAECVAWMLVLGIVISIALLAGRRALLPLMRRIGATLMEVVRFGSPSGPIVEGEPHRMPFAVIIALGVIAALAASRAGVSFLR